MNKKILIVTSEFPPLPGGIGNHALNLATYLTKNSYEVNVLTDQRIQGNTEKEFDSLKPFSVMRIPLRKIRLLMYLERLWLMFKLIKETDVVIASGKFSLWMVGLASVFYNRKSIAVIHGTEVNIKNSFLKTITNISLKKIKNVITVSNYTKGFVKGLDLKKLVTIPNGYTIENTNIKKRRFNTFPNLVTVGRVSFRKGQINVIKALPQIKKEYPNVCYHMIGIDHEKSKLIKLAKELGVDENIIFYGKQKYTDLYAVVKSSDVFLMLSQNDSKGDIEGFGIAILEANYFGVPAIGSINCGIEDAIKNDYSGILVNPKSTSDICNGLNKILNNKTDFDKNALDWSLNFTWDKIILEYIKIIEN